jgi:hypothetical protein
MISMKNAIRLNDMSIIGAQSASMKSRDLSRGKRMSQSPSVDQIGG